MSESLQVREDEMTELEEHLHGDCVVFPVKGGVENSYGKVNILLQTYIARGHVESFSLVSDLAYVAQVSYFIIQIPYYFSLYDDTRGCGLYTSH